MIDVLLLQLGTPDAPTAAALRPYLRQFLSDPRVIELSPWKRWLLVNLIIVPFRSPKSAAKYRNIWNDRTGSPLLDITRRQTNALGAALGDGFRVHFGMRYGQPSIGSAVRMLARLQCRHLVVIPMFPQYSATTTASAFDALFDAWKNERVIPSIRLVKDYHVEPAYLDAVKQGILRVEAEAAVAGSPPQMRLLSFHGIPRSYTKKGDPYQKQSAITGKAVARSLGWEKGDWKLCFQSRLGREPWLTPYTDETLESLGKEGIRSVLIAQPGFTADCLETIDEIGREGVEEFHSGGGETLWRVPCLNDDPAFIAALKGLAEREALGWR